MSQKSPRQVGAQVFIAAMAVAALGCFCVALTHWQSTDPLKFLCYLAVALLASSLKIKLPGINGTMSVNFLFILLGVLEMSFAETLVMVDEPELRQNRLALVWCMAKLYRLFGDLTQIG